MKTFTSSVIIFVAMAKLILEGIYCFILLLYFVLRRISNYFTTTRILIVLSHCDLSDLYKIVTVDERMCFFTYFMKMYLFKKSPDSHTIKLIKSYV